MEKSLPIAVEYHSPRPAPKKNAFSRVASTALLAGAALYWFKNPIQDLVSGHSSHSGGNVLSSKHQCVQPDAMFPSKDNEGLEKMWDFISTQEFKDASIKRHSGAVKFATESYDDMGKIGEDKRWETMPPFAEYLEKTFPRMHKDLKFEKVNTHGLLYTWEGSDESLKPLVLMAHQDVVPVPDATLDAWTHPPYSGFFDGEFIWGRGSFDCKNQLIAVMETMELMLESGWTPKRTVVMSFGFDEEISGREGAGHLAPFLLERYGKGGVAAIVDEGAGFMKSWDTLFALPGVGEKGYTDVHVTVRMPGGHSSIPSDYTSIGVASELIVAVESERYPIYLDSESPFLGLLQCAATHGEDFPKKLKKLLKKHDTKTCKAKPDYLALEAAKMGADTQYLMQTSQAVDVIQGGVKNNALPERTSITINHRINIGDKTEDVWKHLTELAKPIAKKHNLTLHAFDGTKEAPNSISLAYDSKALDVAPITPTSYDPEGKPNPFNIVSGTTRAIYGEEVIVAPGMMTGNTDTRYYWDLTHNIFRYTPGFDPKYPKAGLGNIHTVDERVSVVNHINMVKWFTLFVRNMDVADLQ